MSPICKAQAVKEMAPYHLYFNRTLFSHGNFDRRRRCSARRATQPELDRLCAAARTMRAAALLREDFRNLTLADVERLAETPAVGHAAAK